MRGALLSNCQGNQHGPGRLRLDGKEVNPTMPGKGNPQEMLAQMFAKASPEKQAQLQQLMGAIQGKGSM